jgi:hypothetical protein
LDVPLLDHFHPPLSVERYWESFHSQWAGAIVSLLNHGGLPPGYIAELQIHMGTRVEVDVGALETLAARRSASAGGTATLEAPAWTLPQPALDMPAMFPDQIEVLVYRREGGPTLVGAVELISPRNKDREDARRAFAAKCCSYLQEGIGLVIVDIVTARHANLHNEIVNLVGQGAAFAFPGVGHLYSVSYGAHRRGDEDRIAVWPIPLIVGQPLPTVPLPLRGAGVVPLDLETSYMDACDRNALI